jgi:aryl-alcohol dehydrogenase-like predicted oxidoreductase
LVVSALGLGCMGMSEFYGAVDGREAIRTIRRALELGVTLFDTADMYGPFANERLLGRALRRDRDAAVVATKFGFVRGDQGSWLGINGRPEYVRAACEASLRRLGVDRIDLYYQHCVDRAVPIEETVGAMAELVSRGVVRYLGLSEAPPALVRRAHAIHPISAVQGEYSLLTREPEATVLPVARELGIGFVAYSPLCRGLLAGGIRSHDDVADDLRGYFPRFQRENLRRNMVLVERLRAFARLKAVTPAQVALAWLLRRRDVVPIPGTKRRSSLEENVRAIDVELDADEAASLEAIFPPGAAAGARYPAPPVAARPRA